jgi:hypothetical protein
MLVITRRIERANDTYFLLGLNKGQILPKGGDY